MVAGAELPRGGAVRVQAVVFSVALLAIAGCDSPERAARLKAAGDKRIELFRACMQMAAAAPCETDLADVVSECSNQSFYMTNYIKGSP